ncbi:MAG: S9 family peptidase [Verrucomicrobia bacterium]|nr:S9 family peptidase [Verrucomicrobiota bacterium]
MSSRSPVLVISGLALFLVTGALAAPRSHYPATRQTNHVDVYHGVAVADPYRWLEDDNAPETKAWVEAQNKVTFAYLESIPERAAIKARLTRLWNYERYGVPVQQGGRYFFAKNDGLQNQSVIYTMPSLDAAPTVLLDPNKLSPDGTVALTTYVLSDDGNLLAYGLSSAGSDWQEWKVRDVHTGQDVPDQIEWVKFASASWTKDSAGFFYSRFDEPAETERLKGVNHFQKLYFHRLGSPQSEDKLVYHRPDEKEWRFDGDVTPDGRYLVITIRKSTSKMRIYYLDLQNHSGSVVPLIDDFESDWHFIDNDGPVFWLRTDRDAPRGRVVAIDVTKPGRADWRTIIPEAAETLTDVSTINNQFICTYLKDAHSQVKVFDLDGKFVRELALPGLGTVSGFSGKRADTETFYSFASFTVPGRVYRCDARTGTSTLWREPQVDFKPDDFETKQVFYTSKDGTRVPMFITHRRGLKLNGRNPTWLYGYGGFNISLTPAFSVPVMAWLEMGGVYAVPNLRGGGEYGEAWHLAGTRLRKQNVFDDFIAAAEWLITQRYTSRARLAIEGRSNGGLLVGACMTQRPELFGACLPGVGVMDMLRFHQFTIGHAWTIDYGSSDNAAEFRALRAYSPYHNLRPRVKYPPTLVTTADHDDRVVPGHSFKFAARLQECQASKEPVLIRIDTRAGHGAGKPTAKLIEEAADKVAFLMRELKLTGVHVSARKR